MTFVTTQNLKIICHRWAQCDHTIACPLTGCHSKPILIRSWDEPDLLFLTCTNGVKIQVARECGNHLWFFAYLLEQGELGGNYNNPISYSVTQNPKGIEWLRKEDMRRCCNTYVQSEGFMFLGAGENPSNVDYNGPFLFFREH